MIESLGQFVSENLGLVIVLGVVLVIIVDEVLGVSRGLLGDDTDNLPATPKAREEADRRIDEIADPLEEEPEEGEATVDDFLPPPPKS